MVKRNVVAGEPVVTVITVTNYAGRPLTFASDGRTQWLDFTVRNRQGDLVNSRGRVLFGKMSIKPGETLAKQVDLTQHFLLNDAGNYTVSAVVHMPGDDTSSASTERVAFTQNPGTTYWNQKVGLLGKPGQTREFSILNFSGDERAQLYAKVTDGHTGQNVRTFLLGDVLLLRKPVATIDRQQRMHVMFLSTPTFWTHCQIDTNGKLLSREFHQRGAAGDPQLLTFGDGTVRVANSVLYNAKAAAEQKAKIRKASDRPVGTF